MTVLITAMSTTVLRRCLEHALLISLPVPTTAASHIPGVVTLITTVGTVQMKLTAVSISIEARQCAYVECSTYVSIRKMGYSEKD